MSKVVYKYKLISTNEPQSLDVPIEAKFIAFAFQRGCPCVWAEVDPGQSNQERSLVIVGTGHEVPEQGIYIGTCQDLAPSGEYVWHLYELPNLRAEVK